MHSMASMVSMAADRGPWPDVRSAAQQHSSMATAWHGQTSHRIAFLCWQTSGRKKTPARHNGQTGATGDTDCRVASGDRTDVRILTIQPLPQGVLVQNRERFDSLILSQFPSAP
jgi:hypothetical protein